MKLGRAPGNDGVTAEMLQWAPNALLNRLIHLVQQVWDATRDSTDEAEADEWPDDWLQAIVIPLWKKKHPKSNKGNWRGIALLSVGAKIVARIVAGRLQKFSETFMDEEQQGFRKNRSVDDVVQITRRLVEEFCFSRTGTPVVLTLCDIEKAYPRVTREALWQLHEKRGAPVSFIRICNALHNHTVFSICTSGVVSEKYAADRGLKAGCPSSPPLFNIYHQAVLCDFHARRKGKAEEQGWSPGVP